MYYLAYGSNLNLDQMKNRCPDSKVIGCFNLEDYKLVYRGRCDGHSHLTLEKSDGDVVPMGVFKISHRDLAELDKYEGYPVTYVKEYFTIKVNGFNKKAFVYVMNPEYDYHMPTNEYIRKCSKGYEYFHFDKSILHKALDDTMKEMKAKVKVL